MNNQTDIKSIWESYEIQNPKNPPIIELINSERIPVGAIYLNSVKIEDATVALSQTNHKEKYAFYYNGVLIYFTYYRKLTSN